MAESPFIALAVDPAGQHLPAGGGGADWDPAVVEDVLEQVGDGGPACVTWRAWLDALPGRGCLLVLPACALRDDWRQAATGATGDGPVRTLLVRFEETAWDTVLAKVAEAYGLSPLERQLAGELADCGNLDLAAARCQLDLAGMRNTLSRLRRKLGTRNTPEAIEHLLALMAPHRTPSADDSHLADLLGLSSRQMRVVRLIAEGTARIQVAEALGVSMATLKPLLSQAYATLGIDSASELASLLAQARFLSEAFARREGGRLAHGAPTIHKLLNVTGRRKVGYSLQGPVNGPVALILHSTITCRAPPSRFVRLLAREGWRVLAIDRPGFGDTSPAADPGIDAHVAQAAADVAAIAKTESIDSLTMVSRGAGHMAIDMSERLGPLVSDVILVNPTPPIRLTPVDRGPLGAIKRRFATSPGSIRLLINLLLRIATPDRLVTGMRRSFSGSPPDLAALDDPHTVADYLAAAEPLGRCVEGYVVENSAWARGWEPTPPERPMNWFLLFGGHYVLHESDTARAYFTALLPGARCRVIRGAGQMLLYSHPEEALAVVSQARADRVAAN